MPRRLQQSVACSLAAVFVCLCPFVYPQSQAAEIKEFKLKDYGWQPPPARSPHEWAGSSGQQMAIDHSGRILVGYAERESEALAIRGNPKLSFHIIRLTREGKVDLSLALATSNWQSTGIYLDAEDHILARANDTVQMLIKDDQATTQPTWKPIAHCSMNCRISQSPSHRTLIIRDFEGNPDHTTYTILDTSSSQPRVVQTCPWVGFYAQRITDKFAYWPGSIGAEYFTRRFSFCDHDHPEQMPLTERIAIPLNDELFVINSFVRDKPVVGVVSGDGQSKFRLQLSKSDVLEAAIGDEGGHRFAASIARWGGGSRVLDISGNRVARRIVVFDTLSGQQLASVPVSPHNPISFVISPDGHRLAVLVDGLLTAADLEEVHPHEKPAAERTGGNYPKNRTQ
jgi:hypothetical protein